MIDGGRDRGHPQFEGPTQPIQLRTSNEGRGEKGCDL